MKAWRTLAGERLERPIKEEVEAAIIREKGSHRLKVCIGTDSQVKGERTEFATAIVFLREGRGGFLFLNRFYSDQPFSIRERMIREVAESVDIAYQLCPIFDKHNVELEVHADINTDPQFKSNIALKEAMGYILGMGYTFRAKPDAFASTSCANKIIQ
ncbi:MAG: hypothetical protein H6606_08170 [Flavobacteriales bacterium]|nr:hypothetical protein [Flavobacteriales bacterium]